MDDEKPMTYLYILSTTLLSGALIWLLRAYMKKATEAHDLKESLLGSKLVAEAAAHSVKVLAERIGQRDKQIEKMVEYVEDHGGVDGLVDVLNTSMLPNGEGSDDPEGMPN